MIKDLRQKIQDLNKQKEVLQKEIDSIYQACCERINSHIWNTMGIDIGALVKRIGRGSDSIDANTMRSILFGKNNFDFTHEQWDQKVAILVDAGLISVAHWFYDHLSLNGDIQLSDEDYLHVTNPPDGKYYDPIYGDDCSKEHVEEHLYPIYSTTEKYNELVKPAFDEIGL